MKIAEDKVASLAFKLTTEAGEVLDTTEEQGFEVLFGRDGLPTGVRNAIEGLTTGGKFEVKVGPEDGYGEYDDTLLAMIPLDQFEDEEQIELGGEFMTMFDDEPVLVYIKEINEDSITVDANHPLAGMQVTWTGEILDVREATPKEVLHGLYDDHQHAEGECDGNGGCGGSGECKTEGGECHSDKEHTHGDSCSHEEAHVHGPGCSH